MANDEIKKRMREDFENHYMDFQFADLPMSTRNMIKENAWTMYLHGAFSATAEAGLIEHPIIDSYKS